MERGLTRAGAPLTREHSPGDAIQPRLEIVGEIIEPPPGDHERLRHDIIGTIRSSPSGIREDTQAVLTEHALKALHPRTLDDLATLPHSSTMAGTPPPLTCLRDSGIASRERRTRGIGRSVARAVAAKTRGC